MKNNLLSVTVILLANLGFSQTIYTTDGTLTANRTVTLNGKTLNFTPATASPTVGNFFINGTSGNIGLGTTTPTSRFQINSGDIFVNSTTGKLILGTVANFNDVASNWGIKSDKPFIIANSLYPLIQLRSTLPAAYGWGDLAIATLDGAFSGLAKKGDMVIRAYNHGSLILSNDADGDIKFTTKVTEASPALLQMVIDKNGNVGVGTPTPDSKLAVNGQIHAKEVKVDLIGWPDYVFESNYNLPTLKEVEKHIAENGRLINIPSAIDVEKNGAKLGEMNKLLLEKVEELTLYIIQLNKDVQQLKNNKTN